MKRIMMVIVMVILSTNPLVAKEKTFDELKAKLAKELIIYQGKKYSMHVISSDKECTLKLYLNGIRIRYTIPMSLISEDIVTHRSSVESPFGEIKDDHMRGYLILKCKDDKECISAYHGTTYLGDKIILNEDTVLIDLSAPIPGIDISLSEKGKYHNHIIKVFKHIIPIFNSMTKVCQNK